MCAVPSPTYTTRYRPGGFFARSNRNAIGCTPKTYLAHVPSAGCPVKGREMTHSYKEAHPLPAPLM